MHPNEAQLRKGYEAFASGDLDTIRGLMDPNIAWTIPGRSALAGTYHGIDEVLQMFGELFQATNGTFRTKIVDACANDERVICIVENTVEADGETVTDEGCAIYTFANGKQTSARFMNSDPYRFDEIVGMSDLGGVIGQPESKPAQT